MLSAFTFPAARRNSSMEVGLRVVRGPDWKYGEQDGGEGHVGTVVELGEDSTSVPDDCVVVLWDSGIRKTYRAGHEGGFDLLVLDNGPCGTKHPGINCDGCKVEVISGIRWKCSDCINFDFCTKCYMSDAHDVRHSFYRIYSPSHERQEVGRRRDSSQKRVARGIFTNATVCRGCDWKWGNQDGQTEQEEDLDLASALAMGLFQQTVMRPLQNMIVMHGLLSAMQEVTSESANTQDVGTRDVRGPDSKRQNQDGGAGRVGTVVEVGGPALNQTPERCVKVVRDHGETYSSYVCFFEVGNEVICRKDLHKLKKLQQDHGGRLEEMSRYTRRIARVRQVDEDGDVHVVHDDQKMFCYNPGALDKCD
ncbi:E3 ubiquitin-protein ligase MIB2-like [Physella acuta]|uniref:E3 ubiquitin-protein ligase MIB2-like n=1 Tax=Physella acuta TaxID=109671 RepID=UPI0027DE5249|nr:E3 ubiquitin-protein ligase MIB2-like [Physella acuta]